LPLELLKEVSEKKGWAWRLQGTYKRGADIKTADYYLANTGIQERNFSATIGYNTAHWGTEAYFSYFDTQLGIFLFAYRQYYRLTHCH
jgi:iron complex outermembrane receptor protein